MAAPPISSIDLEHVLAGTRELWQEMRGQRLFVTGGTGFFGCWLLETFCFVNSALALDAHAVVLTRDPAAFRKKMPHLTRNRSLRLLRGDICSFKYPSGEYRFVIHAANEVTADTSEVLLDGTERVLSFAAEHGTRKLLYTSSGAASGPQPNSLTHMPESYLVMEDALQPPNMYAESKHASELMCVRYSLLPDLRAKIARCWAFCGPHLPLDRNFAVGNFIGDVLRDRPIHIKGDGTARRSYLYAADLCIWLWTILFQGPAVIPINVGSSERVSMLELAQIVAETLGSRHAIQVDQKPVAGAEPSRYVPSVERAAEMLGLRQQIGLRDAIQRTADWYKSFSAEG